MDNKRGQLSIETMIIYGLVILVTLSVIGGLLYFNVLDLGSYLPDKCDLGGSGDLKCEEMKFTSSSVTYPGGTCPNGAIELGVRNIGQKPIEQLTVTATDDSGVHFGTVATGDGYYGNPTPQIISPTTVSLPPGEISRVSICTPGAISGKILRGTLDTQYKFKDGAITQESSGSIRVKAS